MQCCVLCPFLVNTTQRQIVLQFLHWDSWWYLSWILITYKIKHPCSQFYRTFKFWAFVVYTTFELFVLMDYGQSFFVFQIDQMFSPVFQNFVFLLSLGVSICLDRVSIKSLDLDVVKECILTVEKISTASKSASQQLRNLGQDRDFLISSWHQCPDQKVLIEIEKFVEIWKFQHFLTVCLDLDQEVRGFCIFLSRFLNLSVLFIIFRLKRSR